MNTFTLGACFQHELHTGPYFMTFAPRLEVEEFEKKRKDENSRDRKRKEAEERRQGKSPSLISLGLSCVNYK